MMGIMIFGFALMAYLIFVEPTLERRAMRGFYHHDHSNSKRRLYIGGFLRTLSVGLVFLVFMAYFSISDHQLFLVAPSISEGLLRFPAYIQAGILIFMAWWISYFFIFGVFIVRIGRYFRPYIIKKLKPVESIMPETVSENAWWVANAFISPVEELIYRGFIFFFFAHYFPGIPLWGVAVISISIEAIHYAPRWVAMKYVATSGLAFTLCFLIFHSVFPAMLLHIIYDVRSIFLPFKWVRQQA